MITRTPAEEVENMLANTGGDRLAVRQAIIGSARYARQNYKGEELAREMEGYNLQLEILDSKDGEARAMAISRPAPEVRHQFTANDSGIYSNANGIYKIYKATNGDHMLAKRLVADKFLKTAQWEYCGAAGRFVKITERMTLEQAKKFGVIYGVCAMCGRTLTDEASIAAGIGPICAGKVAF